MIMGSLKWVPTGHRIVDPSDPDIRTVADIGYALGVRFNLRLRPMWLGPWRLVDGEWQRPFGSDPDEPSYATLGFCSRLNKGVDLD